MLQETKVIKNACMALASIVEARGVLMTSKCLISSNVFITCLGGLLESALNPFRLVSFQRCVHTSC